MKSGKGVLWYWLHTKTFLRSNVGFIFFFHLGKKNNEAKRLLHWHGFITVVYIDWFPSECHKEKGVYCIYFMIMENSQSWMEKRVYVSLDMTVLQMELQSYQADLSSCMKNFEEKTMEIYSIRENVYLLNRFLFVLHLSLKVFIISTSLFLWIIQ